jgi:hypothetical protein
VVRPVPRSRQVMLDLLTGAARRFQVHGLVELDVGQASSRLTESEQLVSWTGFVIATLARAVALHHEMNARRAGNRVLFFDRVDVGATVERHVDSGLVLGAVTIRDTDPKSCAAISEELRRAKHAQDSAPTRHGLASRAARLRDPSVEAPCGWPARDPGSRLASGLRWASPHSGCSREAAAGPSRSPR